MIFIIIITNKLDRPQETEEYQWKPLYKENLYKINKRPIKIYNNNNRFDPFRKTS